MEHGAKTQGRTAAPLGSDLAVAKPHRHNLNHHTLAGSQHRQPGQALMEPDRSVLAPDLTFRKHHQLLTCRQQIHRVAQCGGSRLALVNGEAAQPLQNQPWIPCISVRVTMKRQSRPLTRRPAALGINKASQRARWVGASSTAP